MQHSFNFQEKESADLNFFLEVDHLMESCADGQRQALTLLNNRADEYPGNAEFLWRLCKATYLMAVQCEEAAQKQEMIYVAVSMGAEAVAADDASAEAHKWYAIAVGVRGEFLGIKEKILDGFEFKKHIDRASELAPNDHTVQHLLGR